jgi:hypothetical protein
MPAPLETPGRLKGVGVGHTADAAILWQTAMNEHYQNLRKLHAEEGNLSYILAVFGDHISEREGYKSLSLTGMSAVHFYLINKYGWLPRDVKSMSYEDMLFVLGEEMRDWTLPKDAM